jgi:hypothetical protein
MSTSPQTNPFGENFWGPQSLQLEIWVGACVHVVRVVADHPSNRKEDCSPSKLHGELKSMTT